MYVSSQGNVAQIIIVALVGGPTAVFWGLSQLREERLIENTPRSKIRSAALGLVELAGFAEPQKLMKSPCSNLACCWWHCTVEEYHSNGRESYWSKLYETDSNTLFYVKDETGRVLVNPNNAELRVLTNRMDLNASTRTMLAPVLNGWGLNDMSWFGAERRLRIVEKIIGDSAPVFILGELISLAESPQSRESRFHAFLESARRIPTGCRRLTPMAMAPLTPTSGMLFGRGFGKNSSPPMPLGPPKMPRPKTQ